MARTFQLPSLNTQLESHIFSGVFYFLLGIFTATFHIWDYLFLSPPVDVLCYSHPRTHVTQKRRGIFDYLSDCLHCEDISTLWNQFGSEVFLFTPIVLLLYVILFFLCYQPRGMKILMLHMRLYQSGLLLLMVRSLISWQLWQQWLTSVREWKTVKHSCFNGKEMQ